MGGKGSKGSQLPSLEDLKAAGMSRDELRAYLSTHVGRELAPPAAPTAKKASSSCSSHGGGGVPEIRVNNQPVNKPSGKPGKLRSKMQKQLSSGSSDGHDQTTSDQVNRQLALLDGLEEQEHGADWAHMRDWLLYHLHETLDSSDDEDDLGPASVSVAAAHLSRSVSAASGAPGSSSRQRHKLQRQMSMDSGRVTQRLKLGHSAGTPGSSFESTTSSTGGGAGGARASAHNSFDSSPGPDT